MSTPCNPPAPRSSKAAIRCAVLVLLSISLVGCSEADKRKWKHRSAEQNYSAALESTNATERRDAVVRIGESSYVKSDAAFNVLDAVARTDSEPQIRCIAIRALGTYDRAAPVATLLTILTAGEKGGEKSLAANDDVRWESAKALLALIREGLLSPEQRSQACDLYLEMMRNDRSRNVRIVATEALGEFQEAKVLTPLIHMLRNEDFMFADNAERSLMALTGTTHDYDADAWSKWLEETQDPFQFAGRTVVTTRPAGPSWWDKQQRAWRRAIKLNTE